MVKLSPQQEDAMEVVHKRLDDGEPVTKVFGYAGTGKTTIAKTLAENAGGGEVFFAAFTGKAASVLTRKGCPASTIHSLIYRPKGDAGARIEKLEEMLREQPDNDEYLAALEEARGMVGKPGFELRSGDSPLLGADLLVIDEVSMVGRKMAEDLLSFGVQILVLGDPAQLPPVGGQGYFTEGGEDGADVMLTQIHRQALNSPVLRLATDARRSQKQLDYRDGLVVPTIGAKAASEFDQVLVGTNATRWDKNEKLRKLWFKEKPERLVETGEKIIVLSNDKNFGVLNGQQFYVLAVDEDPNDGAKLIATIDCDCYPMGQSKHIFCDRCGWSPARPVKMWRYGFEGPSGEKQLKEMSYHRAKAAIHATYGYAITVHKSQGSEWSRVLVIDESRYFRKDAWRWRYTAITRAAEEVVVVR